MKLLLDENLPHPLRDHLPGHDVYTVAYMGWSGRKNGELLALAAQDHFDALITIDAGIEYQQNLGALPCAVVLLVAESNAFEHLEPLLPKLLAALQALQPRTLVRVA